MKIKVEKHHIDTGQCASPTHCMIAEAIREQEPMIHYVAVRTNGITITWGLEDGSRLRRHFAMPLKAAKAIIKFDRGEEVAPFSFSVDLIDERIVPLQEQRRQRDYARKNYYQNKKLGKTKTSAESKRVVSA